MAARHKGKYMSKAERDYHENYEYYFGEPEVEDEEDEDEEQIGECYTWCGNPAYPNCMDSCKLWDD